jgi:hypothetical protein
MDANDADIRTSLWRKIRVNATWGTVEVVLLKFFNNLFIAAGAANLATSTDGKTWTARTSGLVSVVPFGAAFGNGTWVIGGDTTNVAYSTNAGVTWTVAAHNLGGVPPSTITFGAGVFIATATNGNLSSSPDGIIWTPRTSTFGVNPIFASAFAAGRFVITGSIGANGHTAHSVDGITWVAVGAPNLGAFAGQLVLYSTPLSLWFIGTNDAGATSPDGITWTARVVPNGAPKGAVGSDGRFVLITTNVGFQITVSLDGLTYTNFTLGSISALLPSAVAFGVDKFVFVIDGGSPIIANSEDGFAWTTVIEASSQVRRVTVGNNRWVAGGPSGGLWRTIGGVL